MIKEHIRSFQAVLNYGNSLLFLLATCYLLTGCSQERSDDLPERTNSQLLELVPSSVTGISFINTVKETPERNLGHYDYFYNGSGVAIGDINNDGLPDVFLAGNDAASKLFLNEGNFSFRDISNGSGIKSERWSTGVTMVDINNDGFLDIYVCNSGPFTQDDDLANEFYINNGDLTFTERATEYGIDDPSYSTHAVFFDMENDGDLDLLVLNHSLLAYGKSIQEWYLNVGSLSDENYARGCNTLYRNDGDGSFNDITREAGMYKAGFGLGVSVTDLDDNGFLDVFVANDYHVPDYMFMNNGDNTFTDKAAASFSHTSFYSMGCDAADFNNDLMIDLAVVDMTPADNFRSKTLMESMDEQKFSFLVDEMKFVPQYMYNTLNINRSNGNFSEVAHMTGVAQTDWSWAALFADFNNSGRKDLLVTNGYLRDTKNQDWIKELKTKFRGEGSKAAIYFDHLKLAESHPLPNYIYENDGGLHFSEVSEEWGFSHPSFSNGVATGDLDGDGDLDMIINNLEQECFVFRNHAIGSDSSNYLRVSLHNSKDEHTVLNSEIYLYASGTKQLVEYSFVRGYMSSMEPVVHFGLGNVNKADSIVINWTDQTTSTIRDPEVNKLHVIDKGSVELRPQSSPDFLDTYFVDLTTQAPGIKFKHEENPYNDFSNEILLPHKQSTLGPCVSKGDVNGDGMEDFYVGGAHGQQGELYLQHPVQGLVLSSQPAFAADAECEDLGALFFDADNDNDLDLYVCSGGGEFAAGSSLLQDRLYLNDGSGRFFRNSGRLPEMHSSTMAVCANDMDADGDLDLFVGGRNVPGKYPYPERSYVLINDGGKFSDHTAEMAPEFTELGMVTSAIWIDTDKDGLKELMIAGEWMELRLFRIQNDRLDEISGSAGIEGTSGWWYSLGTGDFDNDGDMDVIAGNLGLNNKFHPSAQKPFHVFANDFDNNGTTDIVLSKHYKGSLAPVRGKECSSQQMPFLAEKFPLYSEFASSTIYDLYGDEKLDEALHYEASSFAHLYLENTGNGTFNISELPEETQIAPVNDLVSADFNRDGHLDIVVIGNKYNTEVETPAYDAGKGLFLKGQGDGTFIPVMSVNESGLFLPGNTKQAELIYLTPQRIPALVVTNNNGGLQLIAWRK